MTPRCPCSAIRLATTTRWFALAVLAIALALGVSLDEPSCRSLWAIGSEGNASGNAAGQGAATRSYERELKPVLKERCYACHGPLKQEAGLRVDSVAAIKKGGESGSAVDTANPRLSRILSRVAAADATTRMPPEGQPLAPAQIAHLREWLDAGAPAPVNDQPEPDPRDHWAFRPPVRPPLPRSTLPEQTVSRPAPTGPPSTASTPMTLSVHPVDAFVDRELSQRQLTPRPEADKATLLRRVTLDLIGLPPTRDELRAFLADSTPTAYERVVDRLLDDPRYGERWARHWMDVWRYADWHGRRHVPDVWNSAPQVWRWRDWIVDSLNRDHGYDRLVREMLAGDELATDNPQAAAAAWQRMLNLFRATLA